MVDARIHTFLELCKTLNYTRAAEKLHITQPAVTQHIQWLEKEYEVSLFEKQGKRLGLTREGELLRDMAAVLCVDDLQMKRRLKNCSLRKDTLRLGATLTVGEYVMPGVIQRYLKEFPNTDISMHVKNTESLLTMLKEGSIDFAAIEGNFDKKSFGWHRISREPYIGVCGAQFWETGRRLDWDELLKCRLIIREEGSGTREIFTSYLAQKGHDIGDFAHVLEISNMGAVKAMAIQNMGITFLYQRAVEEELSKGSLISLQIDGFFVEREFYFVYLKDSIFSGKYDTIFQYFMEENSNGRIL